MPPATNWLTSSATSLRAMPVAFEALTTACTRAISLEVLAILALIAMSRMIA
ncbi:hypothetical protein D3C80_1851410 [compost metagenome]